MSFLDAAAPSCLTSPRSFSLRYSRRFPPNKTLTLDWGSITDLLLLMPELQDLNIEGFKFNGRGVCSNESTLAVETEAIRSTIVPFLTFPKVVSLSWHGFVLTATQSLRLGERFPNLQRLEGSKLTRFLLMEYKTRECQQPLPPPVRCDNLIYYYPLLTNCQSGSRTTTFS